MFKEEVLVAAKKLERHGILKTYTHDTAADPLHMIEIVWQIGIHRQHPVDHDAVKYFCAANSFAKSSSA